MKKKVFLALVGVAVSLFMTSCIGTTAVVTPTGVAVRPAAVVVSTPVRVAPASRVVVAPAPRVVVAPAPVYYSPRPVVVRSRPLPPPPAPRYRPAPRHRHAPHRR